MSPETSTTSITIPRFHALPAELHLIIYSHLDASALLCLRLASRLTAYLYSFPIPSPTTISNRTSQNPRVVHAHFHRRALITTHQRIEAELRDLYRQRLNLCPSPSYSSSSTTLPAPEAINTLLASVICTTCGLVLLLHSPYGFDDASSAATTAAAIASRRCIHCAFVSHQRMTAASSASMGGWYWMGAISSSGAGDTSTDSILGQGQSRSPFRVMVQGQLHFSCTDCQAIVPVLEALWDAAWAAVQYPVLLDLATRATRAKLGIEDAAWQPLEEGRDSRASKDLCKECWVSHWSRFAEYCLWRGRRVEEGEGGYAEYWEMIIGYGRGEGRGWLSGKAKEEGRMRKDKAAGQ